MTRHERALASLLRRWPWALREAPVSELAEWLYQRLFIGWREPSRPREDFAGDPAFVAELLARTGAARTWEDGFTVTQRSRAGAFVARDGLRLFTADASGLRPPRARTGQRVAVRVPCARQSAIPGFFTVVSRAGRLPEGEPHLRLYLHVTARGVPDLLEGLLTDSSLVRARFEAKVGNEPAHYRRRDTAVLYVTPRDFRAVALWCQAFRRRHARDFRADTPPMTWPLGPGLSACESPSGTEESYGAHRCRLIAEGLALAREEALSWAAAVSRRFAQEGLDWAQPWLGRLGATWLKG
ncbi:MAG: T3SS effector HopA1 family protein [Myxococcota bacterium]